MKNIHYSVLAAAFAVPLLAIIMLNSGHFSYTLDDAYIHLALSEGIGNLHYGTNPGEICSPSSSILWPLLLAPLSHLPIHHYLPLLLNIVFVFLIAGVLHALIRKYLKLSSNSAFTVCFIVIVLTNQIGLAFTGMEHSLHILLCLVLLKGIAEFLEDGALSGFSVVAMILLPLVRFEGLAMSVGASAVLLLSRKWKTGIVLLAAVALPLVLTGLAFHTSGLPLLPSSVLVKTELDTTLISPLSLLIFRAQTAMENPRAIRLLIAASILAAVTLVGREASKRLLAGLLLFMALGHIVLGKYGWFARYDVYVMVTILAGSIVIFGDRYAKLISRGSWKAIAAVSLVLAVVFAPEARATLLSPLASTEIYRQHGSMHLLAEEYYGGNVVANDIGVLSYRNDHHVVDVVGLSSERARLLRQSGGSDWMGVLADEYNAGIAMIYSELYRESVPEHWVRIASFTIDAPKVVVFNRTVDIYLTDQSMRDRVISAVAAWESALPERTSLVWLETDS